MEIRNLSKQDGVSMLKNNVCTAIKIVVMST